MKIETRKILTLTKVEQKAIHDLYEILNEDESLTVNGVWNILADICIGEDNLIRNGYIIKIVD